MDFETKLRQAIGAAKKAGRSYYDIAKASGVNYGVLHRFVTEERCNITIQTAGKLLEALGLEIRPIAGMQRSEAGRPARPARPKRKAKKKGG